MTRNTEITLGNLTFTAHALNLGEAEDLADTISEFSSGTLRQKMAAARAIVLVAIKRDQPNADDAMVRGLVATPAELMGAVAEIMRISGYARASTPGEQQAAPETAAA